MSLENSLKEVCEGLRSSRANERKKNGEILKDFLTRNAVPCLLRENTLNKRGYTWSNVFDDINDYVMKELEKYETSKTFDSVTGPLLASLLNLCVSGANKGGSYIKCDKVLNACLIILKDSRLAKGIGDAYITLLYRHVLPFQYYVGFITPKTWEELLEVSITACSTNISKLDDFTKLRIVLLVMRNGKNSCQFVLPLRDILHPLKKCFLKLENDKKVQEVIMDIIILLLETLSTESRLTMCKFSEDVLPMVLKFYTHSLDRKKKILLFKLLNGVVILHHPKGRLQKEEASLAYDWEIWNKHLKNVLEIVCLETVNLQKNRKQNDIPIKANDDFYVLSANVFYQVFSMPEVESNDEENLSKRPRLSFNKNKRFKDIIEELGQSHVPWLGIVNKYLENYGNTVTNEYLLLITYIINSISKNSADYLWEIFESFTIHVLNNSKKHFISMGESDEDVLTALWNSCVRNSTLSNMAHTTVHKIIQELLSMKFLDFQQVQPLMKLYYDKGMPVTNSSINTLNIVFHKYYSKCSSDNLRIELFTWLVYGEIGSIEVKCLKEFISKLMANENINYVEDNRPASTCDYLHSVLFNSIEDSILYGEYEFDVRTPANVDDVDEVVKSNIVMETHVQNYLKEYLSKYVAKLANNDVDFVKYVKFVNINIFYFATLMKCNKKIRSNIKDMQIYCLLKQALGAMCEKLHSILKTDAQIVVKTRSVEIVTQLMKENFDTVLDKAIRSCFYEDLFKCINRILTAEQYNEDIDIIEENEDDININTLKHNCVYLLAAFCRKMVDYRDDILDFILDPKCYNFKSDVQCALKCVGILLDDSEQPPYDLIVHLMQNMCKNLYRDSISSYGILSVLKRILDKISFLDDTKRQNCYIIIKSYLLRAKQGYYPPKVAGLVYECAIKIATLNRQGVCTFEDTDVFEETVVQEIKGKIQSIRLYASHLLKAVFQDYTEDDVETFHKNLFDIFLVDVSRKREVILKDEAANRTLSVLHAFRALAETNTTFMQKHIIAMLTLQKEKSLDKTLLKKVFNIIIKTQEKDIETYLKRNVLSILYYWYTNNMGIENLPVYLFGCKDFNSFVKMHLNWLLPADILWSKKGNIHDSNILKHVMTSSGQSLESIIQKYYNYFIVICMPYKVSEKYFLDYTGSENLNLYKKSIEYSSKMFQQTCQILKRDTWNNLFEKNIPELIFLAALNLCDSEETSKQFNIKIQGTPKYYYYTTSVFLCILKFFGESKEEDIMDYLCENHSLTIFKALFHLWQNVRMEKSFKLKVLSLNTYITFVDNIPLGYSSDAFVCNFICKSYVEALQLSRYKEEIRIYAQGLKGFLEKMFPSKLELARKSISQLLPILVLKKEEGFEAECAHLLNYLFEDLREYLSESVDVVDYVRSLSQGRVDNAGSVSLTSFMDKFKVYKKNLSCPSYEILLNLREFISVNKGFINILYNKLDCKGFSEDCGKSPIHEMIYLLNNILKSTADAKTITEACNCLSEIGTYDLKSLVTVPPPNVQKIVHINPNNYFVGTVIKCLTEVIFTEDPTVTEKIAQALNIFLQYFENIDLLDIEDLDRQILKPLISEDKHIRTEFTINTKHFDDMCTKYENGIFVKLLEENYKDGVINECNWLKQVTNELLSLFDSTSNCLEMLEQVCSSKTIICEKILPSLIGLLVYCLSEIQVRSFSDQINNFFNYIWKETHENNHTFYNHFKNRNSIATVEHSRKMIIQNMLHVVDFLRLQKKYYKQRAGRRAECYNYLNLDYSKVAWAASVANQHLVALFYGELWALSRNDGVPPSSPEATANLPNGAHVLQLFRKCYVAIGEMDALDGCGTAHLTIEKEKREHLINTCQYSDALLLHDIALSCEDNEDPRLKFGVVRSLHKFGMHHLALQYIKSLPESNELNEIKYECLSYLGDWSELVDVREIKEKSKNTNCHNYIFKALHYACLKDSFMIIEPSDYNNKIEELVNDTKLSVSKLCINLNMENCQNVYKIVGKLHLLTDIEKYTSVRIGSIPIEEILHKWSVDNLPRYKDFKHLEALISQRVLLLEDMAKLCEDSVKKIISLQLQYAKLALLNDRIPMAQRLLAIVKKWHSSDEVVLVDSEISWAKGHKDIALSLVRNILRNEHTNVDLTATSLRKYALWIAESKRDNPRDIINKYLLTSLKVLKESENAATRLKVYHDIAKFADAEYKQVVTYMKSSVFEHKVKCMENMKGTASTLKSTQQSLTKDEKKALLVNDRFGNLDEAEIANTKIEKETFLLLAMKYYLLSLKQCDKNNLSIFRIISLWLENRCFQFEDGEPQNAFKSLLDAIPSRKFIAVLPQLVPHLTNENSDFAIYLKDIIKRCALEHPHHTLPLVFSLKNSEKDKLILNESGVTSRSKQKTQVRDPLVAAAENLVTELQNSQLAKIIQQMEALCDAIISFANYKPQNKSTPKQSIPSAEKICRLKNLDSIPVPTATIAISSNCDYSKIYSIKSFDSHFELVGGINCPKKIFCTDSSGHKRILLVKGEDDLKQDAVMQQVFNIVNMLLEQNPITSRNNLIIRTYKVVPMSRQSGVLEWCVGTIPLGTYLSGTGNNGAHNIYRPQDISCKAARIQLMECHQAREKTSNKEKLRVFLKILSELKPVFHYFFTEHFLDPVTWYERRLAYTKSVATSSMVGYILGLGDRHVMNILIDKRTAEVIHIDFGIAFDQGKTLHTPETVPFRLTQDMVAGFGASGVEGLFTRCCEKTMRLLRDNQETLLTILEVLLCDPLYSWRVANTQQSTPANRNTSVNCSETTELIKKILSSLEATLSPVGAGASKSSLAERALLCVSSKLVGAEAEAGAAGGVAVPGQVARLIRAATDHANLSRLYPGWQPYL